MFIVQYLKLWTVPLNHYTWIHHRHLGKYRIVVTRGLTLKNFVDINFKVCFAEWKMRDQIALILETWEVMVIWLESYLTPTGYITKYVYADNGWHLVIIFIRIAMCRCHVISWPLTPAPLTMAVVTIMVGCGTIFTSMSSTELLEKKATIGTASWVV